MSRIGKKAISVPSGATLVVSSNSVSVEGPKGKISIEVPAYISINVDGATVQVSRSKEDREGRAQHGLIKKLIENALIGVTNGHRRTLEIYGVGFKAQQKGTDIVLSLGYSHEIVYPVPTGIQIKLPQPTAVEIEGIDKALVGNVAATIRDFYKPEPYKGKGVRYGGENIRRKQGKVVG